MEKRLIDAKNAISILKILSDKCCDDKSFEQAISVLESAPTIDAVPVVRCKDCKFCSIRNQWCRRYNKMTSDNWYCADGERKHE